MLVYPDGRTMWPVFTIACRNAARYLEIQLIQDRVDALHLRVVAEQPLDDAARAALTAALHRALGHPFEIAIEQVDQLTRSPVGKLEEFVSHVTPKDLRSVHVIRARSELTRLDFLHSCHIYPAAGRGTAPG